MRENLEVAEDGALTIGEEIPPLGERTISTHAQGEGVVGSVSVVSDGPLGSVLRFDIPSVGVAGVALEMDAGNRIFTALPVVPVRR